MPSGPLWLASAAIASATASRAGGRGNGQLIGETAPDEAEP